MAAFTLQRGGVMAGTCDGPDVLTSGPMFPLRPQSAYSHTSSSSQIKQAACLKLTTNLPLV